MNQLVWCSVPLSLFLQVRELEEKLLAIGFSACADSQLRSFVQQLQECVSRSSDRVIH